MSSLKQFASLLEAQIKKVSHIVLIAHKAPDGDAYGSLAGMQYLLAKNYPHLSVTVVVPKEAYIDTHVSWILGESQCDLPESDLILLLDTSLFDRTALPPDKYPQIDTVISIDHHEPQPESLQGYRDIEVASTTVILTDIARCLDWSITPDAATALLLGIYTDTGGFIHRNSNQRAFETAGFLLSQGANQQKITGEAFGSYSLEYLHELGEGLGNIVVKDRIACLFLPEGEKNPSLKNHIIGYLSGISGVDIACVLIQKGAEVKGSFRTRGDEFDMNKLAQKLGGGGHKKASGFTLDGAKLTCILEWNDRKYTPQEYITFIQELI